MNEIFSKIWGWVAGAAALIVAAAGLYLRGRSTGRADERQERGGGRGQTTGPGSGNRKEKCK